MKSLLSRLFVTLLIAVLSIFSLAGCAKRRVTLVSIAVTPSNPSIFAGAPQQFTATGTYSDNTMKDITATVAWVSSDATKATISAAGLATGVAAGNTNITASLNGVTSPPDALTVKAVTLVSIAVTPVNPTLAVPLTLQFTAMGTYNDTSVKDITATVTWASSDTTKATISATGLAKAVAGGNAKITASLNGVTSPAQTLTVAAVTLSSIQVTPANPTVSVGNTQQFKATGTYSDGSNNDITNQVTWASSDITKATIAVGPGAGAGLATAVAVGTSNITAALGGVTSPPDLLTITMATLTSIAVTPASPTIAVGGLIKFTATGTYSDSSMKDLTGQVIWSSSASSTASIDSASGIAQGLAAGMSNIKATDGAIASSADVLTVSAAAARFAYTGNLNIGSGTISIYAVDPASGTFLNRGYVDDKDGPAQVIPDLSGQYAYALEGVGTVKIFSVDPVSGNLTLSANLPVPNTGITGNSEGVLDPTGRFLYVANNVSNNVTAYVIDFVNSPGNIKPLTGSPYALASSTSAPLGIVTDRNGKFVYVADSLDNKISGFTINATGTLTALSPTATFATGVFPAYPAVSPSNVLYVPNNSDNTISAFTINADGSLTAIGAAFADASLSGPATIAVDPSGKYLYVTNNASATPAASGLSGFKINADGSIGAAVPGSPYGTGNSPYGLTFGTNVSPAGVFVVVTNNGLSAAGNNGSDTVTLYSLNTATGALTSAGSLQTGQTPQFTNLSSGVAAPVIAPAAVYATNATSGNISAYTATAGTGALTAAAAPTVTGVAGNGLAATDLAGAAFYTAGPTAPGKLAAFSVTQSTAALTPLTTSPYTFSPAAVSTSVLADPSGRFVYVAGKGAVGSILGYDNTTTPGDLTKLVGSPYSGVSLANLNALAMDPEGQFVFALRTGFVEPVPISGIDGHLTVPPLAPATVAAGTWIAGVVDSSGQYLLALDSATKSIQTFSITPSSGTTPATDGLLTAVGAPVAVIGTTPSNIAIDPLNRFVFVTDSGANTSITVFSFNVTTGAVALVGASAVIASGSAQAAVDASGTYLYVALPGTPGSVATYTIGAGGTLTAVGSPVAATGNGTLGVAISNSIK